MPYMNAHWHCSVSLFACIELNTHISWKKRKKRGRCETEAHNQKLKRTLPDFLSDWTYYKQFLYLHYSILSILCACSLSTLFFYFFIFLQLLCTNMKKVAVQPPLQYKQLETKDSINNFWSKKIIIKNNNITNSWWNWHSKEKWALQVKPHCHRLRHTSVVFVKFTS